ncbi:hypothetical protein TNCV_2169881 [Trichonephila clavipes]|nr:hypothetical protein TNCV_2169881 [Trichonephila clavipes]
MSCRPSGIVVRDADCCAVTVGTGFDSREDMDVCKCIVPARHGGTLNSRRAASPLVRLVEGEERKLYPKLQNEFGKVEQEAIDLSGLSFEEEAGQARRQQKRNIIFSESKKVGHEFHRWENFIVNSFYMIRIGQEQNYPEELRLAQQPTRARAYCAHPNIRGHWALRCVSRCPYQVVSLKRDPSVYAPKQAFGTHLSTHCSRDERLSRPCPAGNKNRTSGGEAR